MTAPRNSDIETRRIPENQLEEYFTRFTRQFLVHDKTNRIDVEVLGTDLGDQFEAENSKFFGITYEPKEKSLEFELEGGDHRILNPKEVWAAEDADGFITAIEVVSEDGTRQVARVKRGAGAPAADPSSAEKAEQTRT